MVVDCKKIYIISWFVFCFYVDVCVKYGCIGNCFLLVGIVFVVNDIYLGFY